MRFDRIGPMKKSNLGLSGLALVLMSVLGPVKAFAVEKPLRCISGLPAAVAVKLEEIENNKAKITVVLSGVAGKEDVTYMNSGFGKDDLQRRLRSPQLVAMVSTTDMKASEGSTWTGAGILTMEFDQRNQSYNVLLAVQDRIYTSLCRLAP